VDAELELVGAAAGHDLGAALGIGTVGLEIAATVDAALRVGCDVLVDCTSHAAVRSHIDLAVGRGVAPAVLATPRSAR
jgi:dihydrodipicolinate reductase